MTLGGIFPLHDTTVVGDWSKNQPACTSGRDKLFWRSWLTISSSYFLNLSTYTFIGFFFKLSLEIKLDWYWHTNDQLLNHVMVGIILVKYFYI